MNPRRKNFVDKPLIREWLEEFCLAELGTVRGSTIGLCVVGAKVKLPRGPIRGNEPVNVYIMITRQKT